MTTMTSVCVRISEEEKRQLQKYGKLSDVLRAGAKLYISQRKSEELLRKLGELQTESPLKTSVELEVSLIREDRRR